MAASLQTIENPSISLPLRPTAPAPIPPPAGWGGGGRVGAAGPACPGGAGVAPALTVTDVPSIARAPQWAAICRCTATVVSIMFRLPAKPINAWPAGQLSWLGEPPAPLP